MTLDLLFQIFSRVGKVTKIVTFTKNASFQALIQFESAHVAHTAKLALDGQNMFSACNTLRVEFSKLAALNVKYNNDKSRDFTNPGLPPGATPLPLDPLLDPLLLPLGLPHLQFQLARQLPVHVASCVLLVSNLNEAVCLSRASSRANSLSRLSVR